MRLMIDRLSYQSGLRYINSGEKTAFAMITLILCVAGRSVLLGTLVFVVMGMLTVGKGGIPFSCYRRLLAVPLSFLLLNTVVLSFSIRETPLELFAVRLGGMYLTADMETLGYGLSVFVTAMAAVSCLYFLSCSTPVTDILGVLKRLKCPQLLIELMLLTYRFIFVLLDSAYAIHISQISRLGNRDYQTSLKSFSGLVTALFIRSVRRSGRLYDAMESRCYDGVIAVLHEDRQAKAKEIAWISGFELLCVVILAAERL